MPFHEWQRDDCLITTDPARVDLDVVHGFLTESYWCPGIPRETVKRSIENATPFSLFVAGRAAGFARVVTDRATVAYVGDVFVLPEARGRKLSVWMMECMVAHPDLQGLRRWILLTRDAHGLYARYGFTTLAAPDRWMERWDPEVYGRQ
jgi:GNAT superfamily N-acetyltransferase